jgi:hypothetical protein
LVSDLSNIFKDELSNTLEQLLSKSSQVESIGSLVAENLKKIESINYIVQNKNGYLNDLKHKIGENNLKALIQTGFIIKGKEISNKDSWKVTKFALDFVNNINLLTECNKQSIACKKEISIFDRFRYFINSKM